VVTPGRDAVPQPHAHTPETPRTHHSQNQASNSSRVLMDRTSGNETPSRSNWADTFVIPWDKMPVAVRDAMSQGKRATPADRRKVVQILVDNMREFCKNPIRSQCEKVAKMVVRASGKTFGDIDEEGNPIGSGHFSLLNQLKNRVEHLNRDNEMSKLRKPKKRLRDDDTAAASNEACTSTRRAPTDSYGCTNWQPENPPDGETEESLEEKRQAMVEQFQRNGYIGADRRQLDDIMNLTYYLQRHMINSNPPLSIEEMESKWPYLFLQRYICAHFMHLTGIPLNNKMSEALTVKAPRIISYLRHAMSEKITIKKVLLEMDTHTDTQEVVSPASILAAMAYFKEKVDSLFLLADVSSLYL
jgi:hypothetical protein